LAELAAAVTCASNVFVGLALIGLILPVHPACVPSKRSCTGGENTHLRRRLVVSQHACNNQRMSAGTARKTVELIGMPRGTIACDVHCCPIACDVKSFDTLHLFLPGCAIESLTSE
jgi:hypothetical protein